MKNILKTEYYCNACKKEITKNDSKCPYCGAEIINSDEKHKNYKGQYFFGGLVEASGWLIILFGIITLVYILFVSELVIALYIAIIICVTSFLTGLFLVAIGQFFQCQVQIERNTRETNMWLKKIYEKN
jgi:DNA-directed RNA polymerase subunit RPC12/RpoP